MKRRLSAWWQRWLDKHAPVIEQAEIGTDDEPCGYVPVYDQERDLFYRRRDATLNFIRDRAYPAFIARECERIAQASGMGADA